MNISEIRDWPKWFSCSCLKCGEWVPRGSRHYCDPPHRDEDTPAKNRQKFAGEMRELRDSARVVRNCAEGR